jgi:threonine/homoserine/homoserine lactone efflux protein
MAPRARRPKPPTARGPAQSIRAPRFYAYPLPHSHTPGASSRLASIAYNCLFVVLVLFIVTALLAALFDIARQLIESSRASRVSDVAITFGTYVVIVRPLLSPDRSRG